MSNVYPHLCDMINEEKIQYILNQDYMMFWTYKLPEPTSVGKFHNQMISSWMKSISK